MSIQGMELFAIGVVIVLFVAVLKQFGILEPMSLEGKWSILEPRSSPLLSWLCDWPMRPVGLGLRQVPPEDGDDKSDFTLMFALMQR